MTNFIETIEGDISDDQNNPTDITLSEGDNIVIATQQSSPRDIDYITITVPEGTELTSLFLDGYTGGRAFIGIQSGDVFTEGPSGADRTNILGGLVYGTANIDDNILDDIGAATNFIGFTGPLQEGNYTIWLNQTGGSSTAEFNFVVASTGTIRNQWNIWR